jgi:hypothetical protein
MLSEHNIQKAGTIDQIVLDYFKLYPEVKEVQAKDLMEDFIKGGVFSKDYKDGLPLREFFKKLEDNNGLDLFKQTKLIRKAENKYWFFVKRTNK